jgi:hypothetical protein
VSEPRDPYLSVSVEGGQVLILLGADDDPTTVENCDGHVLLEDGSRRTFTALTVAEISRLMGRWQSSGEEGGGAYLRIPDLIVLRSGGVDSIVSAVRALAEELPVVASGDG